MSQVPEGAMTFRRIFYFSETCVGMGQSGGPSA
jgi:hypothetical protein